MTKPLTVRDLHGNMVERLDGKLLDGDKLQAVRVPMLFTDTAGATVTAATLANASKILGDKFDEAEIAKLTDQAARHAVVRKRVGATADGRSAAYLDAAWGALAGAGSPTAVSSVPSAGAPPMPVLTDAQRAYASKAVERAVADAGRPGPQRRGGPLTDAERRAGTDRIRGSYAAMKAEMSDAWKPQERREAESRPIALDPRVEAAFRDGKITDNPTNRARAELAQELSDGWKMGR